MRPLIIVNSFWPGVMGGGPRESLSHLLRDVDIPVFIFTSAFDLNGQKLDVIQNSWIEWPPNKKVKVFYSTYKGVRYLINLYLVISKIKPNLIWLNSFYNFQYTTLPQIFSLILSIPILISPRGELLRGAMSIKTRKKKLFLMLYNKLDALFPKVYHFTSISERDNSLKLIKYRPSIVWDNYVRKPIDNKKLKILVNERKNSKKIIFLGRLVPIKGLEVALDILKRLDDKYTLEVYGEFETDNYKNFINATIEKLEITSRVNFKGFIPFENIIEDLSKIRFLLMPTKGENFGHGIYGCLSVGLPVVISNQTPWQDSLGTLVCDTDDTEDYISMITSLENNNEYFEAAFGALSTAQIYHRHLPKPDKFFEAIANVQIIKY